MVLTGDKLSKSIDEGVNPFKNLVIDCGELGLSKYTEIFGWSIELLNLKRYCLLAIKYSSLDKNVFNYSILDEAVVAILNEDALKEEQLLEYFEVRKSLNEFFEEFRQLSHIGSHPVYDIDFQLLGANFDLDHDDIPKGLFNGYDDLFMDYLYKDLETSTFIKMAKDLIAECKKKDIKFKGKK